MRDEERIRFLERRNGRLRKAVTWLRGALHDESPLHHGPHEECGAWECIRTRVILKEATDEMEDE